MGMLKRLRRKKQFWSDRDERPRIASQIRFVHFGKSTLVDDNDDDDLQEVCKLMESECHQKWELHIKRTPYGKLYEC